MERIRTEAEIPFMVTLLRTEKQPLYHSIAEKAAHLHRLGMNVHEISKHLKVDWKTVAKALKLKWKRLTCLINLRAPGSLKLQFYYVIHPNSQSVQNIRGLPTIWSYGNPEIFNTDQGSQFTSDAFTGALKDADIKISMDGKGRWMDNVMIERLWRSLKYECIYLNAYETGSELRQGLKRWIDYYNTNRPHSSLDDRTPDEAYWQKPRPGYAGRPFKMAA